MTAIPINLLPLLQQAFDELAQEEAENGGLFDSFRMSTPNVPTQSLGGPDWEDHVSVAGESLADSYFTTIDLHTAIRRYISDMIRFSNRMRQVLDSKQEPLTQDQAALDSYYIIFEEIENTVQKLRKILLTLPSHGDKLTQLVRRLNPPTFELFLHKYQPLVNRLREYPASLDITCSICLEKPVSVRLERKCKNSCNSDGEPACRCQPQICVDCLLQVYWTQSEREKKTYSNCPLCRSPFCLLDIVPLEVVEPVVAKPKKRVRKATRKQSSKRTKS